VVEARSLHVPNAMMQGHLQSNTWLDVEKFPLITLKRSARQCEDRRQPDHRDITGTMTIKGISHPVTVPVKISYLKDKLKDRTTVPATCWCCAAASW